MFLTRKEERMFDGEEGVAIEKAMKYLVKLGEAYDAEKMVAITYAHVHPGMAMYEGDVELIEDLADTGAHVRVPSSTTILSVDIDRWKLMGAPEELAHLQKRVLNAHRRMGIAGTYTCQPLLSGYLPSKGSHISSLESSAIIYFNSMLGARTNRDGFFSIYAAITGKYPLYGYHMDENRIGTHLVDVKANLTNTSDFSALGFFVGDIVGAGVPVFTGIKTLALEELKALGAALATSGAVAVYHIPGITAEARTIKEAFRGEKPREKIEVGDKDIRATYGNLQTAAEEKIDLVNLGCPHYSIEEIRQVAELLKAKKIDEDVKLWVCTNRTSKAIADRMGYTGDIEKAGGLVICDTCPISTYLCITATPPVKILPDQRIRMMVTDSAKQAKRAQEMIRCDAIFAPLRDCVRAAIKGDWK